MRARLLGNLGLVETTYDQLDAEKKEKVDTWVDANLRNEFAEVGQSVVHGKSTTNVDTAYNKQREEAEANKPLIVTGETAVTEKTSSAARDIQIKEYTQTIDTLKTSLANDKMTPTKRKETEE